MCQCTYITRVCVAVGPEPDEVTIDTDLTTEDTHQEGTLAEIECTIDDCYPEPDVTLYTDGTDSGLTETGMQVYFEVTLHRSLNLVPLTCCAEASSGEWSGCSANAVVLEVKCECLNIFLNLWHKFN